MLKGKKILVVDDEQDILDLLAFNFKKQNMLVVTANKGKDAITQAKKHSPDIILPMICSLMAMNLGVLLWFRFFIKE